MTPSRLLRLVALTLGLTTAITSLARAQTATVAPHRPTVAHDAPALFLPVPDVSMPEAISREVSFFVPEAEAAAGSPEPIGQGATPRVIGKPRGPLALRPPPEDLVTKLHGPAESDLLRSRQRDAGEQPAGLPEAVPTNVVVGQTARPAGRQRSVAKPESRQFEGFDDEDQTTTAGSRRR